MVKTEAQKAAKRESNRKYYAANKAAHSARCKAYQAANTPAGSARQTLMGMKTRCLNPNHAKYKWYGGRGITICEKWLGRCGFKNFVADVGERPSRKHTLHRKHRDGNYEPGNCVWSVDHKERNLTWMLTKAQKRALFASIPPYRAKVA